MSGIYLHIPFCSQACSYCNFHFSTSMKLKKEILSAMRSEIHHQTSFLDEPVQTIYFGGGTPSLLTIQEIEGLVKSLSDEFDLSRVTEFTFEANPENITADYLENLKALGINRLSIGIQSFFDRDLKIMNRVHDTKIARTALETALQAGLKSINIDLIYGLPWSTSQNFEKNLEILNGYPVDHLSAYALTIEPRTALSHRIKTGQLQNVNDEMALEDFQILQHWAGSCGFEHYEISNLSLPGHQAVHNSNYWLGNPYLGIGPSAHSYDGKHRYWNVSHNPNYIKTINEGALPNEEETLNDRDVYNESVMLGLRLSKGLSLEKIESVGKKFLDHLLAESQNKIEAGILHIENDHLILAEDQRFFADGHASDLFLV
ncbi:MAG: radical SAM family heme chaperone HemW [Saprospiraceae bacterium]|nr:radical SAM family heme chaperone HemW [Saprospiraceae bacterium]